jgi:hypothetical protein
MIQTEPCTWKIMTEKGIILKDDIKVSMIYEAEDYVKRYISSFNSWTYELIPLGGTWNKQN